MQPGAHGARQSVLPKTVSFGTQATDLLGPAQSNEAHKADIVVGWP